MKNIMFQGTASNVGKSVITLGVCRILHQDGYSVVPFKSQNMSLTSKLDNNGMEMGTGQYLQAKAAGIEPECIMNPILLKPCGNHISEVMLNGEILGKMSSNEYKDFKPSLIPKLKELYAGLSNKYEIVVLEGAGSPVEINMNSIDLSNMEMARISDSPVILIADIDRGGVFASIYGTINLLNEDDRKRVKGIIINKFRGNKEYFADGVKMIEDLVHIPVIGVIPHIEVRLEEEDGAAGIKDVEYITDDTKDLNDEFDKIAEHLRNNMDIQKLYSIILG